MLQSDFKSCWPLTSSCKIELSSAVGLILMSYWPFPSLCKIVEIYCGESVDKYVIVIFYAEAMIE